MKCQDCDREYPLATNADTEGWVLGENFAFCPTCLRLARCEKNIDELSKEFKKLLSVLMKVAEAAKQEATND